MVNGGVAILRDCGSTVAGATATLRMVMGEALNTSDSEGKAIRRDLRDISTRGAGKRRVYRIYTKRGDPIKVSRNKGQA